MGRRLATEKQLTGLSGAWWSGDDSENVSEYGHTTRQDRSSELDNRLYAIRPMGMAGTGAPSCELSAVKPCLGFAAATRVQAHTTGNADAGRPEGPEGGRSG